ncbi:hypothetical protein NKI89_08275 [Mesorhizobium sp. M0309]|uniref:hypothetical protein n=1 Tax=Mesorhizobium sp. M0309 TaxID=2956933 RepID=UPI00333D9D0F
MDDLQAFMELSALLTGLYKINDGQDAPLRKPVAAEYARRLRGVFPKEFDSLTVLYKQFASETPKPAIDDQLLIRLRNEQVFKETEVVSKQIVNIWYFSQFKPADHPKAPLFDGGYYELGAVWPLIKAHPIGFSDQQTGYWSEPPS